MTVTVPTISVDISWLRENCDTCFLTLKLLPCLNEIVSSLYDVRYVAIIASPSTSVSSEPVVAL